jgi:hypothetical protein
LRPTRSVRGFASAPDANEFVAGNVVDTPAGRFVSLNAVYRIGGREVNFEPLGALDFTGRGLLVFEGDVTLPDVRLKDPARDAVTILSLHGSITLAGSRCEAGLVALEGAVTPRKKFEATGILAAGNPTRRLPARRHPALRRASTPRTPSTASITRSSSPPPLLSPGARSRGYFSVVVNAPFQSSPGGSAR